MIRRMVPTTIVVSNAFLGVPSEIARTNISEIRIISDWGIYTKYSSYQQVRNVRRFLLESGRRGIVKRQSKNQQITLGPLPPFRGQNYQSDSPISSLLTNKGHSLSRT